MVPAVTAELLTLGVLYMLLCGLLLVLCLATRWSVWVKAMGVVLVSGFYVLANQTLTQVSGWPTEDLLPPKFVFLSAVFDEPSPVNGKEGAIFVWLHPVENGKLVAMPRAYRLPYQKDLRGILEDGMKKARGGNVQMGSTEPRRGKAGTTWLRQVANEDLTIKLSDVPRAQLPEK
jgi:hypothetical protein